MPYLLYLSIIRSLFKVDNNDFTKPQSQARLHNKPHDELLKEAKQAHKKRVKLTNNCFDQLMLIFESVIRVLTCGRNKWSRIVKAGVKEIKDELNIFNYMRKLRLIISTVNALTTFNQRRLLEAQVESSFLLKPFAVEAADAEKDKKLKGGKGSASKRKRKQNLGESSSEESVEDFEFLEQELNETRELDEMTRKLLNGIIQVPPKDKKRLDRMSREEMRERRR